ncbi:MAG TPA: I78 family peptidase inhibitor [Phenylobacterium sp.]|nr:I78 family peptidase inhibitor [Phenylobacterium sp.]
MNRRILAAAMLLTLAACANEPMGPPPSSPSPSSRPPPPRPPPASTARPVPRQSADMCGASKFQGLVGRPRTEIPVPVMPSLQRVACTTCPVTMDYNPRRLNFFFDAESGRIKEVKCG